MSNEKQVSEESEASATSDVGLVSATASEVLLVATAALLEGTPSSARRCAPRRVLGDLASADSVQCMVVR